LPADKSNIGYGAPTLIDVATRRKRKVSNTKVTTHKKKKSSGKSSAVAVLQTDTLIDLPSTSLEGKSLNPHVFILSEC
jgi:hypothetical protein